MRRLSLVAVLVALAVSAVGTQPTPQNGGAAGTWHRIQKLRTTASVLHTTAHPDDEHGGVIARLSRKDGARLALMTLNRGESGDNAIGPQLFDGLGLIRTDELVAAGRYYGIDQQYFTTVVDYGFSKRLDEAFEKWGRENVLRDVVRVLRMERPWVVLSRFQGNQRDGHGNHQTAGLLTQDAAKAAGDPTMFPEQLAEGLRPWTPYKVYIGGVRADEAWTLRIDSGEFSPWLGDSYDNYARFGLSFQRSQNSGRYSPSSGPNYGYYTRVQTRVPSSTAKEDSVWDGLDTTYAGLFTQLGRPTPDGVGPMLARIDQEVARATAAFTLQDPSVAVPGLIEGLRLTREVIGRIPAEADALHVLRIKETQFEDAINEAMGMELTALAQPAGVPEPTGPMAAFAAPPSMTAPVPGQTFEVRTRWANRGGIPIAPSVFEVYGSTGWSVTPVGQASLPSVMNRHDVVSARASVTVAGDAPLSTKPYFRRAGLQESRYVIDDLASFGRPASRAPLMARGAYRIGGVDVVIRTIVKRREPKLPYGDVLREIRSVPRVALTVSPTTAVVPLSGATRRVDLQVDVLHNGSGPTTGTLALTLPRGWTAQPAQHAVSFARPGERASFRFRVTPASVSAQLYDIEAVVTAEGRQYKEGYEVIDHRDLDVRYLYRPSVAQVRGIDVRVVPGLKVGYVMGVGDQVPLGLQQLGAQVSLLGERDLASGNLAQYDAILTGTRAYAVRDDLKTYNRRLLDYAQAGGNLIVLYNTQEMVPAQVAPFPAELPRGAEEVSEEDSPVEILAPTHQAFSWPNRITKDDFNGWVEQRGSKFFSTWDAAYTPMISTFDKGQAPQKGGWVTARYGKGHYTYFAYALHRQLPYGVQGAYRIAANLLALGKRPAAAAPAPAAAAKP